MYSSPNRIAVIPWQGFAVHLVSENAVAEGRKSFRERYRDRIDGAISALVQTIQVKMAQRALGGRVDELFHA